GENDTVTHRSICANGVEAWVRAIAAHRYAQQRLSAYRGVPNVLGQLGLQIALKLGIQNTCERNLRQVGQLQLLIRAHGERVGERAVTGDEEQDAVPSLEIADLEAFPDVFGLTQAARTLGRV